MDDLISRQQTIEHLKKRLIETALNNTGVKASCDSIFADTADNRIEPWVNEVPTTQSEIIRCKDCKHRPRATRAGEGIFYGSSLYFPDDRCPMECGDPWYNEYPEDDFYCANAERREQ